MLKTGSPLPQTQDYSLAEVFAEEQTGVVPRPRMGFSG